MDWLDEVKLRLKKKNQILFAKDSAFLQDLALLFSEQSHPVMALWALEFAEESAAALAERYPDEKRPCEAVKTARDWAAGRVKMREAQRKILDCHAFAKELAGGELTSSVRADIALCHAVGQASAVVHTAGHALGYPMYDLTALVYRLGIDCCAEAVEQRKQLYVDRLFYWNAHLADHDREWAEFMLK